MDTPNATFDPEAVAIGRAVKAALAAAGWSQADLAERAGMAKNTISRRVNGLLPFTFPELRRVAAALDIPLSALIASAEEIAARASATRTEGVEAMAR